MTEEQIYSYWEKEGFFKADESSKKKPYSLLMPPPNLTGELHLGHAMQHALIDAIARFKRLQGFDVLLLPGVDHAGIQFEGTFNKKLTKDGLSKQKLGRDAWMRKAWEFRDEIYNKFHDTWKVMGISADWSREVFTLDEKVKKGVFTEFSTFWEDGLLYKGAYIVQWCPKCGTAIEDVEMEYEEKKEKLYYVRYEIKGEANECITVATARPETIFADVAIAIYPGHPKYAKFLGKQAINPLNKRVLAIIEDLRVEKDFGTGALKITPGHDPLDYEIGHDHGLEILHAVDKTGRLTKLAGEFAGLKVMEGRVRTAEKLEALSAIEKIEDYTHAVPVCERCKTVVEPLISEEWFVKMKPLAQAALKNLDTINFTPHNYHNLIKDWLENIHDWSISRSLWWGHRIPVWYCDTCNPTHAVGKDKDMIVSENYPVQKCKTCNSSSWAQDEQVLDTWFSSGLWPMVTLGWPDKTRELTRYYPWSFEISAPEIKYLWIARMIMLGLYFNNSIPFKNMFFHGMIRDLQGRKFSKSLGNGIDPNILREQWGTDALRMALYSYAAPGRDAKASRQTMDQRCKNFRNFATKLKNIDRYVMELKPVNTKEELEFTHEDDREIKKKFDYVAREVTQHLEAYNFHLAVDVLYNFLWHDFADAYIEKSKQRRGQSQPVLEYVLKNILILLHPFMPFTTEDLFKKSFVQNKSIMNASWPADLIL